MNKLYIGIVILVVSACGIKRESSNLNPSHDVVVEETIEVESIDILEEEIIYERLVYHPAETILTDLVHTKLEVGFDWEKSRMNGIAWITAKPHFYATDSLMLDAKGMDINYIAIGSIKLDYTYKNDVLTIRLNKTYTKDDTYTIMIDYVAKPEERESEGSAAILDAKGLYFINPTGEDENKMPQIWTQGETEASSVWFPTIDSPNAKTTQEIFMKVDDKYTTLSNGKLISSKKVKNGMRIDHWKQDLPHAPYLFMMAVGEFKVIKDSYTKQDGSKIDVNYYVEPEWEASAQAIFGETPEMIDFFSKLLGVEYQWDKYNQIVVRDYVSGAMENTGAVIFGDYAYKNERELLDGTDQSTIAHELFHHWFGDLVTCESWSNLPLNESFANYSQYLWDEHRYGIDEADYNAEGEKDGYYQSASMQGKHDLIWFDYGNKEEMFDGHSYNKGGRILHMLRNYLGDDAFFAGMHNYLEANKFQPAEFHQLRLAFEEVSGEDLNWFFNQWFLASGDPKLKFTQEIDSANHIMNVSVEQTQDFELTPVYKLPFEIAIWDNDGKHTHKVMLDEVHQNFSFSFNGELKGFVFDNQQALLAKKTVKKTKDQYIFQYYKGERYLARKEGLLGGAKDKGQKGQQLILDALDDSFWHIKVLAIGKVGRLKNENRAKGIEKLKVLAQQDENSAVRSAAISKLSKYLEEDEMIVLVKDRVKNDLSYGVVTTALRSLGKIKPEEAMLLAEGLEKEQSSKMISGIAQIYAGHGGPEKFDFLATSLSGNIVNGIDALGLMNSFTFYLSRQGVEELEKALPIYEAQDKNGGIYVAMFLPQNISHLEGVINEKISELNIELAKHEENNDPVYANQTRKKIVQYEELLAKYSAFSVVLSK